MSGAPGKRRRRPGLLGRLALSVGLAVSLLGALELVARALDLGDRDAFGGSRLAYQHVFPPLYRPTADGRRFRARDPRLVDRSFPASAPPERIFVFGESAVAGLGLTENGSFPRALERQLRKQGERTSVVNVGIVALDSRQVLRCVQDVCARQRPEAVVLHVGNNEVLELHATKFVGRSFGLTLDGLLSRGSALYLGLKNARLAARNATLTPDSFQTGSLRKSERDLVARPETAVSKDELAGVVARYVANLRRCCETARAAGAKVVLVTVSTNLLWEGLRDPEGGWLARACGGPVPETGDVRTTALRSAYERLTRAIADPGATALDRWHARFERAHVRRALGDARGARDDFQAASDEDPHLRRCLSVMNEAVRDLAREQEALLVDGARVLADASPDGITGFEMLYDYVHYTPEGAERLGAAIAQALLGDDRAPSLAAEVERRRAVLAARAQDALEVEEYLGWNADRSLLADRNLWKGHDAHRALDHVPDPAVPGDAPGKVQLGTATPEELVWAANHAALAVGGEARARELYAMAKRARPGLAPVVDANLAWLDAR